VVFKGRWILTTAWGPQHLLLSLSRLVPHPPGSHGGGGYCLLASRAEIPAGTFLPVPPIVSIKLQLCPQIVSV
jgi:hypothetical protein